jgi:geranylgeranyl pyrophosphate synthase
MNLVPIYSPVKPLLDQTETELVSLIDEFSEADVREVLSHFLSHPGKRIRPALLFLACCAAGKTQPAHLPKAAAAFELVHSASLVHDDVIDKADMRRDLPTVNGRFGNTAAVLAGDILYAQAFLLLSGDVPIFRIILDVTKQMCIGEIFQLRTSLMTVEKYFHIIDCKTARLMSACCEVGAIMAGASNERIDTLRQFGRHFGFLYQLVDDKQDGDGPIPDFPFAEHIAAHRNSAVSLLETLPPSVCRDSLIQFTEELAALSL